MKNLLFIEMEELRKKSCKRGVIFLYFVEL